MKWIGALEKFYSVQQNLISTDVSSVIGQKHKQLVNDLNNWLQTTEYLKNLIDEMS